MADQNQSLFSRALAFVFPAAAPLQKAAATGGPATPPAPAGPQDPTYLQQQIDRYMQEHRQQQQAPAPPFAPVPQLRNGIMPGNADLQTVLRKGGI